MIWLTWRQARAQTAMMGAALAVLAVVLLLTGPGLADDYSSGIAACAAQGGDCSEFVERFSTENEGLALSVTAVVLIVPALVGLFWGAPLIARELEGGTHRLVWNQSVTRTRWLAVKLALIGLAAIATAGLLSFAVDWWSDPIDKAAAANGSISRMEPLLFGTRGIVPMAYAAFAFALGVTVGMLVRRTIAAMAITLALFAAVQIAMPQLVRPHLSSATTSSVEITPSNLEGLGFEADNRVRLFMDASVEGGWVLSSHTVDPSGQAVDTIPPQPTLSPNSGPCAPPRGGRAKLPAKPGDELGPCLAEIERLGYGYEVTYHPASRFWPFQWYESGIYLALSLGLAGFCLWWLRHRLA
jgi:ABC-2 family transporter protein